MKNKLKFAIISILLLISCNSTKKVLYPTYQDALMFQCLRQNFTSIRFLILKPNDNCEIYSTRYFPPESTFGKWNRVKDTLFIYPKYQYNYDNPDTIATMNYLTLNSITMKLIIHKNYLEDYTDYDIPIYIKGEKVCEADGKPQRYGSPWKLISTSRKYDLRKLIYEKK